MTAEFQRELSAWARKTFPRKSEVGRAESIFAHFREEVDELEEAMHPVAGYRTERKQLERLAAIDEEIADCLLLLLHLASQYGIVAEDAARRKFEINKRRTWETEDNGSGYRRHIDEQAA